MINRTKIYLQSETEPTVILLLDRYVRETIITCLSLCFPLKYHQSFPLQSRFYSLNKKSLDTSNFYMAGS